MHNLNRQGLIQLLMTTEQRLLCFHKIAEYKAKSRPNMIGYEVIKGLVVVLCCPVLHFLFHGNGKGVGREWEGSGWITWLWHREIRKNSHEVAEFKVGKTVGLGKTFFRRLTLSQAYRPPVI